MPDYPVPPLTWSASDWELYSDVPGADQAAIRLNTAAGEAHALLLDQLTAGATVAGAAQVVYAHLERALDGEAQFGAADTEPDYHAQRLVAEWIAARLGVQVSAANAPTLWRIRSPVPR